MDMQVMMLAGGVVIGIAILAQVVRQARWNEELPPVSKQWLTEQRGRTEL